MCLIFLPIFNAHAVNNCTGATYYDSTTDTCLNCPSGYDYNTTAGKTDISECQIHCNAGTWTGEYTQLEYLTSSGTQYIDTNIYVDFSKDFRIVGKVINPDVTNRKVVVGNWRASGDDTSFAVEFGGSSNSKPGYFRNFTMFGKSIQDSWSNSALPANVLISYDTKYNAGSHNIDNILEYNGTTLSYTVAAVSTSSVTTRPLRFFLDYRSAASPIAYPVSIGETKMYKDNILVADFIPARRNSDGVLGMYDTVTGQFFTNAGTGTFTAGSDVGGRCEDVGAGYYAPASTTNYGSVGTRTACPIGTYSSITNAASCTPCSGATYNNETAQSACKSCPTGYVANTTAGKTSANQCQISCSAGTYVANVPVPDVPYGYTQLEYIESTGTQYIDTGIDENTNLTSIKQDVGFGYSQLPTKRELTGFDGSSRDYFGVYPQNGQVVFDLYNKGTYSIQPNVQYDIHSEMLTNQSILEVSLNGVQVERLTGNNNFNTSRLYIFQLSGSNAGKFYMKHARIYYYKVYLNNVLVRDFVPARRNSDGVLGMYDAVNNVFYTNAGTGTFIAGPDTNTNIFSGRCIDAGAGYWSAGGITNYGGALIARNACPAGTYTVGYGHGADEANDCGRILHLGDSVIYTRKNKPTTPALNIRMENGDMYYIGLSTTDHTVSRLHFQTGDTKYTAFDDSLFYGERDYDTGEKITQ